MYPDLCSLSLSPHIYICIYSLYTAMLSACLSGLCLSGPNVHTLKSSQQTGSGQTGCRLVSDNIAHWKLFRL